MSMKCNAYLSDKKCAGAETYRLEWRRKRGEIIAVSIIAERNK